LPGYQAVPAIARRPATELVRAMNPHSIQRTPSQSRLILPQIQTNNTLVCPASPSPVPVNDSHIAPHLRSDSTVPVQYKLPDQLHDLQQQAGSIRHLDLVLEGSNVNDVIAAIRASLPTCTALTTLRVRVNVPCRHDNVVSWVCHAVVKRNLPVESLMVSLSEGAIPGACRGIPEVLRTHPDIELHYRGLAASTMALLSMPASASDAHLVCSGIASTDQPLMDCLARMGPSKLHLDIELDDENIDAFMQGLLDAGVSSELPLQVKTPSGRSASLQDAVRALEGAHIESLLNRCTINRHLDSAALLQACKALGKTGPVLFALACRTAIRSRLCDVLEVPIAEAAYLQALHNHAVPVVCVAVIPQDLASLKTANPQHVQGLRLDLGEAALLKERQLFALHNGLKRLDQLKALKLQGRIDSAQPTLGSFLLAEWALEELHIDIDGAAIKNGDFDGLLIDFLRKTPPKKVICTREYGSSRLLTCTRQFSADHPPMTVQLTLPAASLEKAADSLKRMNAPWMSLLIEVPEQVDPLPLQRDLINRLTPDANEFAIGQLHIVSLSHPVPNDAVVLGVAAEQIRLLMPKGKGPVKAVQALPMAYAFGLSLNTPREVMTTLRDPLGMMAEQWLEPSDRARLSASTKQVRSQTQIAHNPAAVLPWLELQIQRHRPESYYRPILEGLFGKPLTNELLALAQQRQN